MNLSEEQLINQLQKRNFSCQRCSRCCRKDPGIVLLTKEDIQQLSKNLQLTEDQFLAECCREIYRDGLVFAGLKEKKNYDCIFWGSQGCIVYQDRPLQCRAFPFWTFLVESDTEWREEKKRCPGLDKESSLSLEQKMAFYREEKEAEHFQWKK